MAFHKKTRRILVIKNRAIGDTVLLTGPLRLLRRHKPDHEIHALVRSPAGQLLEGLPYVDRVISTLEPKGKFDRLSYWMRLIRRLREEHYELILNFHASFRTSLTAQCLRVDTCVANHHELEGRNWFSDIAVPGRGKPKPVIDRDLDVLRSLGIEARVEDALPEIILSAAEKREGEGFYARERVNGSGPRVFLGIGGSRATKRWSPEHFATLSRKLVSEYDAQLVMATIDSDRPWLQKFWPIVQADPLLEKRIRHFSNETLRNTAQIISRCSLYVGNDSGLKHVAVALGLKSFTFFGPEAPYEWHPYNQEHHPYAFIDAMPCRTEEGKHWCAIPVCERHAHRCMQDIRPEQVWDEISRVIKE